MGNPVQVLPVMCALIQPLPRALLQTVRKQQLIQVRQRTEPTFAMHFYKKIYSGSGITPYLQGHRHACDGSVGDLCAALLLQPFNTSTFAITCVDPNKM